MCQGKDNICENIFKELSDCFIDIMAQNSSVSDLPESLKVFVDKYLDCFETAQSDFDTCYNKIELYISEKFNSFIRDKVADSEFNLFSINIDCLIDSSLYMNDYYKQSFLQAKSAFESGKNEFFIQDEVVTVIQIISQKLTSFQNSVLFTQGLLNKNNISNANDITECKEETKKAKGDIEALTKTLNNNIENFNEKLGCVVEINTEALNKEVKKVEFRIKRSERKVHETSITVLGIFSAIVLTFNTIIGLFASTMQSLANANTYKFILVLLLIGLMTANILFGLYYFLKYVYKGKQDEEYNDSSVDNEKPSKSAKLFWELIKSALPTIITNIVIIAMIIILICKWDKGFIENRNDRIYQQYEYLATSGSYSLENQDADTTSENSSTSPQTQ